MWSHDNQYVCLDSRHEAKPTELIRIGVPNGKVHLVLDVKALTLGGLVKRISS